MAYDMMMDEDKKKMHKEMLRQLRDEMEAPNMEAPDMEMEESMEMEGEPMMLDAEEVSPELAGELEEGAEQVAESAEGLMEEAEDKGMLEPIEMKEGEMVIRTDDPELLEEIRALVEEKLMKKEGM